MSHNGEEVPPVPDLKTTILQAIQGMMKMMMEDRQERRAQHKDKNEHYKKIKV